VLSEEFENAEVEHGSVAGSGDIAALARANCYVVVPPDRRSDRRGEWVSLLMRWRFDAMKLQGPGGSDSELGRACARLWTGEGDPSPHELSWGEYDNLLAMPKKLSNRLSHYDAQGQARMVDVSSKHRRREKRRRAPSYG